jgi:6-phosphofructokinase 1
MAGKTSMLISLIHNHFVHLPIRMAVSRQNTIDPEGPLWRDVVDATGQPLRMRN